MKIAIVGSRPEGWKNPAIVEQHVRVYILSLPADTVIVSGAAKGVDSWAADEARKCGFEVIEYPAPRAKTKWEFTQGAFKRNQQIVDEAEEIVAFHNGSSGGTADTIRRARLAGKKVEVINPEEER